jgi:hypothetical protein
MRVVRVPWLVRVLGLEVREVRDLREVQLGEQVELHHLRDVDARRHHDVVAARALGRRQLRDHLLVRGVDVDLRGGAVVVRELLEQLRVVVLGPVVEVQLVLEIGGDPPGAAGRTLAAAPRGVVAPARGQQHAAREQSHRGSLEEVAP